MKLTLTTKADYDRALAIVEKWMCNQEQPLPHNFDELVDAIVEYEKIHFPFD